MKGHHVVSDTLAAPAAIGGGAFGGIGSPRELIGRGLDEGGTFEVLQRAMAIGVTIVDTAYSYAGGASQELIGRWLAADPARRDRLGIVDKIGVVERSGRLAPDLSAATVLRCAHEGRRRMGVDHVDVIMTHAPDPATPVGLTLSALLDLIEGGAARHWGVSNVGIDDLTAWLEAAEQLGAPDPLFVENEYNLLARADEAEILPLCRQRGIAYLAYSPLAGGALSGRYRPGEPLPEGSRMALRPDAAAALDDETHDAVAELVHFAERLEVSPAAAALAWVLAQPGVRPIVGVSRPSHLDALAAALSLSLSADDTAALGSRVEDCLSRQRDGHD